MRLSDIVNISHGGQSLLYPHGQNHGFASDGFENPNQNQNHSQGVANANASGINISNSNNHKLSANTISGNSNSISNSENGASNSHSSSNGRTGRVAPSNNTTNNNNNNNNSNSNSIRGAGNITTPTSNTTSNTPHTAHTTHSNIPTSVGTMNHLQFRYAANLAIRRLNGSGLGLIHPHGMSDQIRDRDQDRDPQCLRGNGTHPSHGDHTHHVQNLGGNFLPHPAGVVPRIYLPTPGGMSGLNLLGVNNLHSALGGSSQSRNTSAGSNSNSNNNNNNGNNNNNPIYISSNTTSQSHHNVASMPNYFRE
jgi:hypothetical protein